MYPKALASGADRVCMDLEDAVAPDAKGEARAAVAELLASGQVDPGRFVLRINAPGTDDGEADLDAVSDSSRAGGPPRHMMIPKASSPEALADVASRLGLGSADGEAGLIAVVESARGVAEVERIAAVAAVSALLFGGLDLSVDLGAALDWETLLYARSRVVLAARLGEVAALDMPYLDIADPEGLEAECEAASRLGFVGKAAIHPGQVGPIRRAFSPTEAEVARARSVLEAFERDREGVFVLDGVMVDRPEIERARRVAAWADAHGR